MLIFILLNSNFYQFNKYQNLHDASDVETLSNWNIIESSGWQRTGYYIICVS